MGEDLAVRRFDKTGHDVQQGGLAAAGGPDQADEFALADIRLTCWRTSMGAFRRAAGKAHFHVAEIPRPRPAAVARRDHGCIVPG